MSDGCSFTAVPAGRLVPVVTWDPTQYLKFDTPRLRSALELLAHIDLDAPRSIVDLGCGPGNVTAFLKDRWPEACLVGVDNSVEMLERARRDYPAIEFVDADIATWDPGRKLDLIYSNATLHWLDDHRLLFPRLARDLERGGVLAVQMPHNERAPAQVALHEVAADGPWASTVVPLLRPEPVAEPGFYYDVLRPHLDGTIHVWETEYQMVLTGDNPVAEFTARSLLRPLVSALPADLGEALTEAYAARLAELYPIRPDGSTLYPFKRLFIVGRR
jgi:trans-aconitate 2-methyltransferase